MGFVQNKQDGEDDLGGLLGTGQKRQGQESEARGDRGLVMDTDLLRCETCRRELLPWQKACPDDGGAGVLPEDLPPQEDPLLARFLADEAEGALPDPDDVA